jgi:putative methionine-R-sulfoxide reductase with GAF domain
MRKRAFLPSNWKISANSQSLVTTLALRFVVLSVVTLLVYGALQLFSHIRAQQTAIFNREQLIAQGAAKTVSSFIEQRLAVLSTTVWLADPTVTTPEKSTRTLKDLLVSQPAFRQLAMFDSQNKEIAVVNRIQTVSRGASEKFISRITSDVLTKTPMRENYISPVYFDETSGEPVVLLAVPAIDIVKKYQGVLVAELDLVSMLKVVNVLSVGETGYAYVVDRQGVLMAFKDMNRVLGQEKESRFETVSKFMQNSPDDTPEISIYEGIAGTRVVGTYAALGIPDWAVVIELPWNEAFQPVIQTVGESILFILIIVVLSAVAGVYVARGLAKPLVKLTDTTMRIAGGETQMQAALEGPREIVSLATAFNSMTAQLRDLIGSLEQRVADRTKALATSTEVSRRLSTILDERQLIIAVVNQLQEAFNYYYVHIYLLDQASGDLIMAGGTGDVGASMLGRGHRIPKGKGLVGQAARTNSLVLVSDTSNEPDWLPNPLLPDTRSEVAVPISMGTEVLGVLDVQQNTIDGLQKEDADMLQVIAYQVAVALKNAQAYARTQQQAERESLINEIGQKIQNTYTIEQALQVTARELGQALDTKDSSVVLSLKDLILHKGR